QLQSRGGLGVPKLTTYYEAAILDSAIRYHAPKHTFQWADMESDRSKPHSLLHAMWSPKIHRPPKLSLYPTSALMLKYWDRLMATITEKGKFCLQAPIEALTRLTPWLSLKTWTKYGVKLIQDICTQKGIKPFPALQTQYNIPNSCIFQYLQ
ncbi:Hypothetical predicted protein, partial [Pelobates cultripes]